MKVLGKASHTEYICTVNHTELEKLTGNYYGKLQPLKEGDTMNLGEGYDFTAQIQQMCKSMENSMKNFEQTKEILLNFALMVAEQKESK